MPELRLHKDYSREAVHDIFAPETAFHPQAGTWGLQGLIRIPDRPGDFVFFVTFGQQQGDHVFDEGVTGAGVLTWQSQPSQKLNDPVIQALIDHDELQNTIYLFLRTEKRRDYTYLGTLKYLAHDKSREQPVYFQWQLLDWPVPSLVLDRIGLTLTQPERSGGEPTPPPAGLHETAPPVRARTRTGESTPTFQIRKKPDYAQQDARNRTLGLAGERLVVDYERQRLREEGRADLAEKVRHVAAEEGDGAGYDVHSWTADGTPKFIEVKTTRGSADTAFYLSSNELAFSRHHAEHFYLYRVYGYQGDPSAGEFYVLRGDLTGSVELAPTQYRATVRGAGGNHG